MSKPSQGFDLGVGDYAAVDVVAAVHGAGGEHRALSAETLASLDIHDGTVRISVGIEEAADIVADFMQALDRL